jgi:hypothetical protein
MGMGTWSSPRLYEYLSGAGIHVPETWSRCSVSASSPVSVSGLVSTRPHPSAAPESDGIAVAS